MKTKMTLLILAGFMYNFGYAQKFNVEEANYKHKPIIEMTINNQKTWVLLDTGTDITIININSKDKFGFTSYINNESRYQVPGFGSEKNQLHQVRNCDLKFGDTHLKRMVYAFDISNITNSIKIRTGKNVTAIIGYNMMSKYGFVIDMENNTVVMKGRKKSTDSYSAVSSAKEIK